jgi:DNA-binding PadR family transcriptional regulator
MTARGNVIIADGSRTSVPFPAGPLTLLPLVLLYPKWIYPRSIYEGTALARDDRDPREALPLTPAIFHIMMVLVDGPRHGYGIMQEVAALSDGQVPLGPGTLYRSLQRMCVDGLIEEVVEETAAGEDDARRRYYRLTRFGRAVVRAEYRRLEALVAAARTRGLGP